MRSINVDQELMAAAEAGDAAKVAELLACGATPRRRKSGALQWAAQNGHSECVRLLLPLSDPKANESFALRVAASNGEAECVRLLLSESDSAANDFQALRWAAQNGHVECVMALLPVSGPLIERDGLLNEVIDAGRYKMAAHLIEKEPRLLDGVDLSQCLAEALENGNVDMAGFLSSIIEKKELLGIAPPRTASGYGLARL